MPGMRRLLLLLVLVPLAAAPPAGAKPWHGSGDGDEPARALWLTAPDGTGPGGTWRARLRILGRQDARPVVIVRDLASGRESGFRPTGVRGVWSVGVRFPRAGRYAVYVAGFDAIRPDRVHSIGPPATIGSPAAVGGAGLPDDGVPWWPFALAGALAALLALGLRRRPLRGGLPAGPPPA